MEKQTYIAIDLKSFYASVECMDRSLDPLTTNLVVADKSRTEKTICLAVTPSLKSYGISGRARLFEVVSAVKQINAERRMKAPGRTLTGESSHNPDVLANPALALGYIVAPPRMARYEEVSSRIYEIYLKYVSEEDMVIYSIDEVFIDATDYLRTYNCTARDLAMRMIHDVLRTTGITATAGIGTNLYLAKIAMDVDAKHMPADKDGVRISELDERTYRERLWAHEPITDFWRIGPGIARKLASHGMYTMGDVALMSEQNEALLYQLFGVNAELLIDHAWGWEPCTMDVIKRYRPSSKSLQTGQVLTEPYPFDKARLVIREMADNLSLDLVSKGIVADQLVLYVGYDIECLQDPGRRKRYHGPVEIDRYGRAVPKGVHSSISLGRMTASSRIFLEKTTELYEQIVNPDLLVRRMALTANHLMPASRASEKVSAPEPEQLDLFTDYTKREEDAKAEEAALAKEKKQQEAILEIKKRFGKNAILRGMNFEEGATAKTRNEQIGGHKA